MCSFLSLRTLFQSVIAVVIAVLMVLPFRVADCFSGIIMFHVRCTTIFVLSSENPSERRADTDGRRIDAGDFSRKGVMCACFQQIGGSALMKQRLKMCSNASTEHSLLKED